MNKKIIKPLILIIIIALLVGFNFISNNVEVQAFSELKITVDILDNEIMNYLDASETESINQSLLLEEYVLEPIREKYLKDNQGKFLAEQHIESTLINTSNQREALEALENLKLEEIISEIVKNCSKYLELDEVTVLVIPISSEKTFGEITKKISIVGLAYGDGKILLMIDPFNKEYEKLLPNILAHEYHHSVWLKREKLNSEFTLLDYLIFEGRAESFANIVYPSIENSTYSKFNEVEARKFFSIILDDLDSTEGNLLRDIMFGSSKYPSMAGYNLGYKIVQNYLKENTDIDIEDWTYMEPKHILQETDYD